MPPPTNSTGAAASHQTSITLAGGPKITVTLGPRPEESAAAPDASKAVAAAKARAATAAAAASTTTGAAAAAASSGGFFCSLCQLSFNDTLSLALHRRSRKHREAGGLLDPAAEAERRQLPSVEELRAAIAAKAREQQQQRRQAAGQAPLKQHRVGA